jgi:Mn-dependent DtxR family transcriptional regulator
VKRKIRDYTFSKQEIRILKQVASESHFPPIIRKNLSIKPSLFSQYLTRLQRKGIIQLQMKKFSYKRGWEKHRKHVYFQDSKHSVLLEELLAKDMHMNWEDILSGLCIDVLFQILNSSEITHEQFSHITFWRYTKKLMELGIVEYDGNVFRINPRFSSLIYFLEEYERFIISTIVRSVSEHAQVLWQKGLECLIRVPKTEEVVQNGFLKTATSRLNDFGIQTISDFDVYFYSTRKRKLAVEDIILHTLLIERNSVRYITYSLLLLRKKIKEINKEYLLKEATSLELNLQVNAMYQFLETKGARTSVALPIWSEFAAKIREYKGVD